MNTIVQRLKENRDIQVARKILESSGYKVTKKSRRLKESWEDDSVEDDDISLSLLDDCEDIMYATDASDFNDNKLDELLAYASEYLGVPEDEIMVAYAEPDLDTCKAVQEINHAAIILDDYHEVEGLYQSSEGVIDYEDNEPWNYAKAKLPNGEKFINAIEDYSKGAIYFAKRD